MNMQKQRPLLSAALAFAICLNSTCAISAAAAAPSASDLENPIFAEDFEAYDASRWTVSDGNWSVEETEGEHALWGSDTGLISTGSMEWTDYSLSYDMTPAEDKKGGSAGAVFRYQDDNHFYHFRLMEKDGSKYAALLQWKGGKSSQLGTRVPYAYETGTTYRCTIRVIKDKIECYICPVGEAAPTDPILEYKDEKAPLLSGGIGFRANKSGRVGFDNVLVAEAAAQQIFTVSFEVNGGTQVAEQQVSAGRTLSRPDAPTRDGFIFDGWYADPALETPFDFDTPVASDMTLYAKWTEVLDGEAVTLEDGFSGDLENWSQVKGPGDAFVIPEDDERLLASNATKDRAELLLNTYEMLVNSVVEVDVTVVDDSKNFTVGILTRYTNAQNHILACYTKGTGLRFIDRAGTTKTMDSDVVLEKGVTYRLKLVSSGSTFQFYIDDEQIYSVQNINHPFGKVGLYTTNSSEIYFDNFKMSGSLVPEGVEFPPTGVALSRHELTLEEGQVLGLSAAVEPFYATNQKIDWSSADTRIATVDSSGKVRGVGVGSTDITVTTQAGGYTDTCTVTVHEAPPEREQNAVVPIQWENFAPGPFTDPLSLKYAKAANNNIKCNLFGWLDEKFGPEPGEFYGLGSTVKGYAALAFVSATVLSMDVYDEERVGHSEEEAVERTVKLIASIARNHRSNRDSGGWGVSPDKTKRGASDQTALDANVCGTAAWLMWDYLPDEYREYARKMVEYEANALMDYTVPYYRAPDGTLVSPGDTKGEENAWNSGVLALALSMMPNHQNHAAWAEKCTELMISAYSTPNDLLNTHVIGGKAVKDWLNGSNADNNGIAINHRRIHPDYMAVIAHLLNGAVQFAMAGETVPEETVFNADLIYQAYVDLEFDAENYNAPGGSMYKARSPKIYYPMTNDYGDNRLMHVASIDVFADALGFDHNVTLDGEYWANVHIDEILRLQDRFTDGRTYLDDEEGGSSGSERWVSTHLARAMMGNWMRHQRQNGVDIAFERPPETGELPDGLMQYTVGGTYGTVEYDGVYKLSTMGTLGGTEDAFRYVYRYTEGDAEMSVTIRALQSDGNPADATAGIMFRDREKTADGANVYLGYRDGRLVLTVRGSKGGESLLIAERAVTLPVSVRLEKTGNAVEGFFNQGGGWIKIGGAATDCAGEGTIGFLAASGSNGAFVHADFEVLSEAPDAGTAPGPKNTTTKTNSDGSTTTTVVDKRTGNVTQTTRYPSGVKIVTDTPKDGESVSEVLVPRDLDGVTVTIPTAEKPAPGMAAAIVRADGTAEIIRTSVATEEGMRITLSESAAVRLIDNSKAFADVPDGHWAYDAIQFAASRELFTGTGAGSFNPAGGMSRAMLVTVLARLDGQDAAGGATWYGRAMDWGVENGVTDGTNPEAAITREQLAVMLCRYAGAEAPEESALHGFPDAGRVSDWAAGAMAWAVQEGILTGNGTGGLNPAGTASRAEAAAILMRFVEQMA